MLLKSALSGHVTSPWLHQPMVTPAHGPTESLLGMALTCHQGALNEQATVGFEMYCC